MTDAAARARALDPTASFIVQAPAGSGKTELLIQRYLKLLTRVDSPESIVAITFTRKAASEMRTRVLAALRAVNSSLGQQLLNNPARMRIQTIDSLCASITRQMPWLARFGAPPQVTEKARGLYREAARNTLRQVEAEELENRRGPLSVLLLHLDNDFRRAETLLSDMLERRDQWLRLTGAGFSPDLPAIRMELEQTIERHIATELAALSEALRMNRPTEDWLRLADLVLTKQGDLRKKPPKDDTCQHLWSRLAHSDSLRRKLKEVRRFPVPARFTDQQWLALEALLNVLPRAAGELQIVFRERGQVDFAELSIRALEALSHVDLADIDHLLVDEFQDTSYTQYELLVRLTSGWAPGDGRTLFLVGDPMQSIYRFREADVSLFLKAQREGIGQLRLEPLSLTSNFRSAPAIVDWINNTFQTILPDENDVARGAVRYSASVACRTTSEGGTPVVHAFPGEAQAEEAERVIRLIEDEKQGTVGILVRARSHLASVVTLLRQRGIPFQAIEIDPLGERPIIQDLLALTFALLHQADRIAWLAVLRAPWCGLKLADLDALAGQGDPRLIWDVIRGATEPPQLARIEPILATAVEQRGRVPLRNLVEQTWMRLGGPACASEASDLDDAAAYFDLLEALEEAGDLANFELLREQVSELFAQPDSRADGRLQVMTIHKAKGLEFDHVILPGLGQRPRQDDSKLLVWSEQAGDLLLAPMHATGDEKDPIYDYLSHLDREKGRQENARLLYVAATRARQQLHLLGCGTDPPEAGSFLKLLWPAVGQYFGALSVPAPVVSAAVELGRKIRRLPLDWKLPAPPPPVVWTRDKLEAIRETEVEYEWVGDTLRHIGTVLHTALQNTGRKPAIESMLANLGVPPRELASASARVEQALRQTLNDERGRWLLAAHADAESEYAITGVLDGKTYEARIDRTFIDENGVRWIVDFKTGTHQGGSLENFLENERLRYQPQLERYARLVAQLDERPIRLGLYFPLLSAWIEWAAPTLQRRQASLFE